MKIGFNFKKIINNFSGTIQILTNSISNHETRITTLENSAGGGGSSGGDGGTTVGGSSEIKTYNFKLYNTNGELQEDYEVKCINKNAIIDVYFTFMLGGMNFSNIDNNRIKIGTCTMTDDNNNNINTYSVIPIVYRFGSASGFNNDNYNGNLKFSYDETNLGTNNVELIINKEDIQMIKNIENKNSTIIEIIGGGIFNDNIYIP